MGNLRPVLIIGLVFLGYMLWIEWQEDYGPQSARLAVDATSFNETLSIPSPDSSEAADLPLPEEVLITRPQTPVQGDGIEQDVPFAGTQTAMNGGRTFVTVVTDVLDIKIDLTGGTVVSARLLNYPVVLQDPETKVNLLSRQGDHIFIAQSGLLSPQSAPNHTSQFQTVRLDYKLATGAEELRVPLTWESQDGVRVTKTFIFKRDQYDIEVRYQLANNSKMTWTGSRYDQLQQSVSGDEDSGGFTDPGRYSFRGIGFYSPEDGFQKVAFDDVADEPFRKTFSGGWLAMIQHYFFTAWIPPEHEEASYSTKELKSGGSPRYIARDVSPQQQIAPGSRGEFSSILYVGPKLQDRLPGIAPGLEHTVNYGIFTVFSKPLFWLLDKIHNIVGNWGWAIILLTILVKGAFFKLTEAQYKSMARMRKLQPRIEQLKERYGDDRQRMSQAMMEMYKKEKVNPLGGCLPILVQIPVFIALYWVLLESVELRQAPFILWIQNLSDRDPYFVLPLLNAAFMFATQRLTPTAGMDPMQRKMMNMMPLVFSVMFAFFPAGLVLYWATNAGLSLAQQYYITRKIAAAG
ncbi:MAG: membrane protein insertase YidC [Xanthomonadales bacterium]